MTEPKLPLLTRHFSLAELIVTNTGLDNWPSDVIRVRLRRLAQYLEQVRAKCGGRALIITSGYRSAAVNLAVGGSPTSAHLKGYAADIKIHRGLDGDLIGAIRSLGGFDQLIYEPSRGIVHVSIDPRQRGQVKTLTARGYVNGIDSWGWHRTGGQTPPSPHA